MKHLIATLLAFISLTLHAQIAQQHFEKASAAYDKKDMKTALQLVEQALKLDSSHFDALLLKSNILEVQERYQEAYDNYGRLISYHTNNPIGYSNRGNLLTRLMEFDAALLDFNRALAVAPPDTSRIVIYLNRGVVKTRKRNFEGAYADYIEAYQLDSNRIEILNNLATVADEVGKGEETLRYLHRVLQIDSSFIGGWVNIGFKYQAMGEYALSNKYFDKALQINPDEALSYNNRSYNKYKLGDLSGALKDVNRSLELYPGNAYAYRNRALIYLAQKKTRLACNDLQKAAAQHFTEMYGNEVDQLMAKHCR
jgi:tetratricopeptide (TPR) repeat protein